MQSRAYATGVVIAIVIALALLAGAVMVAYVIYYYVIRGLLARTRTVPAVVLRKKQREMSSYSRNFYGDDELCDSSGDANLSYDCFVLFEVQGGQQEFPVSSEAYADLDEGDAGLLTHKGTLFRQFRKFSETPVQTGKTRIRKV